METTTTTTIDLEEQKTAMQLGSQSSLPRARR
jgi:hypothetical protein